MKFFKANSYDITKLYINQIGISIFSLFMSFAVESVSVEEDLKLTLNVILSSFSILFFFFLLYTAAWDMGAKDKIRVESGRMPYDKHKGMKLSLFANVPNFVLSAVCILFLCIDLAASGDVWKTAFYIFNVLLRFTTVMYNGILQGIFQGVLNVNEILYLLYQSVGFFLAPLFAVAVTQFGYYMGVKDRRIMKLLTLRSKE